MPDANTDYDQYAATYAWARSAVPWIADPLIEAAAGLPAGSGLLDVGCGTGNYLGALAAARPDLSCVGADLSAPMLRQAAGRVPRATLVVADAARALPFQRAVFALVFAVDVIHHIAGLPRFFLESARVLRPGGRLIVVTDSSENMRRRGLIRFFPEILAIEQGRYPAIERLHQDAAAAGFQLRGEQLAEGEIALSDDFIDRLRAKCSSAMRLLPPETHAAGVERVREAAARGETWLSSYTLLSWERLGP